MTSDEQLNILESLIEPFSHNAFDSSHKTLNYEPVNEANTVVSRDILIVCDGSITNYVLFNVTGPQAIERTLTSFGERYDFTPYSGTVEDTRTSDSKSGSDEKTFLPFTFRNNPEEKYNIPSMFFVGGYVYKINQEKRARRVGPRY